MEQREHTAIEWEPLLKYADEQHSSYKSELEIPNGKETVYLPVNDIAYCLQEYCGIKIMTFDSRQYLLEGKTIEELKRELDPQCFMLFHEQCLMSTGLLYGIAHPAERRNLV